MLQMDPAGDPLAPSHSVHINMPGCLVSQGTTEEGGERGGGDGGGV